MDFFTVHAAERIVARYGIKPSESDWAQAFLDIVDGRSVLQAKLGHAERHIVKIAGTAVQVIYMPREAKIITVISPGKRKK